MICFIKESLKGTWNWTLVQIEPVWKWSYLWDFKWWRWLSAAVEMRIPLEKEGITYVSWEKRTCHITQGHRANISVGQAETGVRGKPNTEALLGFPQESHGKQLKTHKFKEFWQALGHRDCPSVSGIWPWVAFRQGKYWLRGWDSNKKVGGGHGLYGPVCVWKAYIFQASCPTPPEII